MSVTNCAKDKHTVGAAWLSNGSSTLPRVRFAEIELHITYVPFWCDWATAP